MNRNFLISFLVLFPFFTFITKSNELPTIKEPITVQEWSYTGPFETGAREGAVDALFPWGYEQPENGYPSAFSEGSTVQWKEVKGSKDGKVSLKISNAPWQVLNESWGIVGINYVTFVKSTFYSDKKYKAKISTTQVRSINLNGRNILADYYNLNRWEPPIIIDSGQNQIAVSLNSYSDSIGFYFSIQPDTDKIRIIENDITFPDAEEFSSCDSWIGIPLVNCTDEWMKDVLIVTGDNNYYAFNIAENINILPLSVTKVPLYIQSIKDFPGVSNDKDKNFVELPIKVSAGGKTVKEMVFKIPLKKHSEDRRETFLSKIDNSVQFYAVKEPLSYDPSKNYGLIFSLHGAGVYALNQAGAYAPRDWAFVAAPTNRREYGFNWHEQGRIDALEVLETVKQRYKIDTTRIMLTGHSMGGHGVWHFGTLYADKFAAIAPACGWMSIDMYFPIFLTKYSTFALPKLKYIWEKGFFPDRPQLYLENLYNTPAMIMVAGADDNVPPVHGRMFAEEMKKLGMNPEFHDLPGRQHWFDDDTVRPGADATDAIFFEDFYKGKAVNKYPDTVKFVMGDPSLNNKLYWIKITEIEKYLEPASIDAINNSDEQFIIESRNVRGFEIRTKEKKGKGILIKWNGNVSNTVSDENGVVKVSFSSIAPQNTLINKEVISGPMKRAYMMPFVIVIGSNTDEKTFNLYLQAARQEALSWWYVANGYMEVLTDKEATEDRIRGKNLILIGTQEDNGLISEKIRKTPIKISNDRIEMNEVIVAYGENAVKFIYPDLDNPNRLILYSTGTRSKYAILSEAFTAFSVFASLPDYVVFDEKVRQYGFAGVKAAGYFDMNWQFDENLSYY